MRTSEKGRGSPNFMGGVSPGKTFRMSKAYGTLDSYPCEISSWYLIAIDSLDLFRFNVTDSTVMRFWPGDSSKQILLEQAEYMEESAKKLKAIREFADSDRYREQLLLCALSGIPRWKFSQVLDVKNSEKNRRSPRCRRDALSPRRNRKNNRVRKQAV